MPTGHTVIQDNWKILSKGAKRLCCQATERFDLKGHEVRLLLWLYYDNTFKKRLQLACMLNVPLPERGVSLFFHLSLVVLHLCYWQDSYHQET